MKKTVTIPNHTIIYIMNLWVKRVGQTIILWASALFFFSCEEDDKLLGYKAKERFDILYSEIPVGSSVYQFDSLVTTNFNLSTETARLLVGTYTDPKVGLVSSEAYTQFYRTGIVGDSLAFGTYDSVSLQLSFDVTYTYGSSAETQQEIAIYELDNALKNIDSFPAYYRNSEPIPTKPSPLGSKVFFDAPTVEDSVVTIRFPLSDEFGLRLYESARRFQNAVTVADSAFTKYSLFTNEFKGIAIKSVQGDKIVSFNPRSANTKIIVHFHVNQRDSIVLGFAGVTSFNRIQTDRSGSEISGVTEYYKEYQPAKRYIQNGAGVTTKIDLDNFLKYADSVSANFIINSAELVISDVESDLAPPDGLMLRILKGNNRFKTGSSSSLQDQNEIALYNNTITNGYAVTSDFDFYASDPTNVNLTYSEDDSTYSGYITLFLQELLRRENGKPVYSQLGLYSINPSTAKTVSRAVFSNNIKLKISFTRPINQ